MRATHYRKTRERLEAALGRAGALYAMANDMAVETEGLGGMASDLAIYYRGACAGLETALFLTDRVSELCPEGLVRLHEVVAEVNGEPLKGK